MSISDEGYDNEIPGLVVHHDSVKKTSRMWLLNKQEIVTNELKCKPGEWFVCTKSNSGDWKFEKSEELLETRVKDWRIDVKVPVMMYRNCAEDLDITTNVKLRNMLFSPIVGRAVVFFNVDRFVDGVLYEIWVTHIPADFKQFRPADTKSNEYDQCLNLRKKYDVFWMAAAQQLTPIDSKSNLEKYENATTCFMKIPGVALKVIAKTIVIKTRSMGICIAPANETVKRGDRVDFTDLSPGRRYVIAGNCMTTKSAYVDFVNDYDNEFWLKFVPKEEAMLSNEYEVAPYGTIVDAQRLVKPVSVGRTISALIRFRFVVDEMSMKFLIKEAKNFVPDPPKNVKTAAISGVAKPSESGGTTTSQMSCYNARRQTTGTVASSAANSTTNSVDNSYLKPNKYMGVVATQANDAYFVYCPSFRRDVLLPKYLQEFDSCSRAINLGQWISFVAKTNEARDHGTILSFSFINPVYPTMPSFNTIMLECKITIPADYNPLFHNGTIRSEFMPAVADKDNLIRECHFGKTLVAIVRRTKTGIPNVFWNVEFIKF